jgi:hypothetical protein
LGWGTTGELEQGCSSRCLRGLERFLYLPPARFIQEILWTHCGTIGCGGLSYNRITHGVEFSVAKSLKAYTWLPANLLR